ncbi:hypothetical protein [Streptomyces sp. NPDC093094]|uniref:hypothetical protein n=1 Tax=Streptomyces sp. NPDC093094 TaxID=3366026 RepID=UPI0038162223
MKSSARNYRISLTTWGWMSAGKPAPRGPARRGAKPPVFLIAAIDDPALPEVLAELATARADETDAGTVDRELSIARKAIGWWQRQGWIDDDPTIGIERRPAPPDRTKALAENQIAALWRLNVALRETGVCGGAGLFDDPDSVQGGEDGGCCGAPAALQIGIGAPAAIGGCCPSRRLAGVGPDRRGRRGCRPARRGDAEEVGRRRPGLDRHRGSGVDIPGPRA